MWKESVSTLKDHTFGSDRHGALCELTLLNLHFFNLYVGINNVSVGLVLGLNNHI